MPINDRTILFAYKTISRHNVHCGIQRISSQNKILIHQCKVVLTKQIHKGTTKQISYMITKRNWSRRVDLAFFFKKGGTITENGFLFCF